MGNRKRTETGVRAPDSVELRTGATPGPATDSGSVGHSGNDTAESTGAGWQAELRTALIDGEVSKARTLVAAAEAVLAAHDRGAPPMAAAHISRQDLAAAKARIAVATGDTVAAHAILVQAIEANPDAGALRALMAEIMLATGRATDIRPVLHHIGRPPAQHDTVVRDGAKASDSNG